MNDYHTLFLDSPILIYEKKITYNEYSLLKTLFDRYMYDNIKNNIDDFILSLIIKELYLLLARLCILYNHFYQKCTRFIFFIITNNILQDNYLQTNITNVTKLFIKYFDDDNFFNIVYYRLQFHILDVNEKITDNIEEHMNFIFSNSKYNDPNFEELKPDVEEEKFIIDLEKMSRNDKHVVYSRIQFFLNENKEWDVVYSLSRYSMIKNFSFDKLKITYFIHKNLKEQDINFDQQYYNNSIRIQILNNKDLLNNYTSLSHENTLFFYNDYIVRFEPQIFYNTTYDDYINNIIKLKFNTYNLINFKDLCNNNNIYKLQGHEKYFANLYSSGTCDLINIYVRYYMNLYDINSVEDFKNNLIQIMKELSICSLITEKKLRYFTLILNNNNNYETYLNMCKKLQN